MSVSVLDNQLHQGLLGDPELARIMGEEAEIAAMIRVEIALANVQARLGMIPGAAGAAIAAGLADIRIAPEALAAGVARDGVVAATLVAHLRESLAPDVAGWLHWGATSQDIADTALVLRLGEALDVLDLRLATLIAALAALSRAHRETICLAHTRMQAAAPTLFGLRVAQWLAPIARLRVALRDIRQHGLAVQLGGAAGNLAAMGTGGFAVIEGLAAELGLAPAMPWHGARDRLAAQASLLAGLANAFGKIGADLALMASSGVGEVSFEGAGGSSTLPQKQNPVKAEVLQALARHAAMLAGGMQGAGLHIQERDGASWTQEWLILPQLVLTAGAASLRAGEAIAALRPDSARMRANLDATNGLALAEAATFALMRHVDRPAANAHVKRSVATGLATGRHLVDILADETGLPVDWDALRAARDYLAPARLMLDRILAETGA